MTISTVSKFSRTLLVAPLFAALAACASGSSTTPPAASPEKAATPAAPAPAVWSDDLKKEDKLAIMKERVKPELAKVFQDADAKKYGDFDCKTCHGPGKPQATTDFLPKLTFKDGKITSFAEKPQVSQFMHEKVVPAMAKALGVAPYDQATGKGFGCMGCHGMNK